MDMMDLQPTAPTSPPHTASHLHAAGSVDQHDVAPLPLRHLDRLGRHLVKQVGRCITEVWSDTSQNV